MQKNLQLILYSSYARELRVYFGHLYLYAPERMLYSGISKSDRLEMEKLWGSQKLKDLRALLDSVIELGKDKAKRYPLFRCPINLDHRPGPLIKTVPSSVCSPVRYVSKTGIIKYSRYLHLLQKTEFSGFSDYSRSEIFERITIGGLGTDYGLLNYLKTTWVDEFINGRLDGKVYIAGNLPEYISFYASRKNGWI